MTATGDGTLQHERNGRPSGRRATRFASVAVALSLALILVGCGGSGSSSGSSPSGKTAEQYVAGACTAMTTWAQGIKSGVTDLQSKVAGAPDVAARKQIFVDFTKQLSTTTDTLVSALQGLGAPAVEGGADVQQQLVGAFQSVQSTLRSAETEAEALPTDDAAEFKKKVNAIGTEIGGIGNAFNQVGNMKNSVLDSAFNKDATCQKMQTIFPS
jgi:hypothetical protein